MISDRLLEAAGPRLRERAGVRGNAFRIETTVSAYANIDRMIAGTPEFL
jgi:hypothetical protein